MVVNCIWIMYQLNREYDFISNQYTYFVTRYSPEGYKGRAIDTEYEDGVSYTDWCLEVFDSEEEAEARADELNEMRA